MTRMAILFVMPEMIQNEELRKIKWKMMKRQSAVKETVKDVL